MLVNQGIDAPAVSGFPGAHRLAGLFQHNLAGFMIVIPGLDVLVVDTGRLKDLGVVEHDAGADVMVDAVVLAILGIVVEAAHDQLVLDGLNDVVDVRQLDVALQVVRELVDFDVHDIRSTFAALQGKGQLAVHIVVGINLHVDLNLGIVRVRVPGCFHLFIELGMQFLECPQGQFDGFFFRQGAAHAQHQGQRQQNSQQFLHGSFPPLFYSLFCRINVNPVR